MNKSEEKTVVFKKLTQFFYILSIALFIYIIIDIIREKKAPPVYTQKPYSAKEVEPPLDLKLFSSQNTPASDYTAVIGNRDIFELPQKKKKVVPPANTTAVKPPVVDTPTEIKKRYRVAAIMMDKRPVAVVEDINKHETLFLSPGDQLNDILVETIETGKVTLQYQGQRVIITP